MYAFPRSMAPLVGTAAVDRDVDRTISGLQNEGYPEPYAVPMQLYAENRAKLLSAMRSELQQPGQPLSGLVLLQGGEEQTRYCTDTSVLFRQESYFVYLFGVEQPGFYGAIDIATGRATLFQPRLGDEYAVWLGKVESLSECKDRYAVDEVFYVDEIASILKQIVKNGAVLYLLEGLNTDSEKLCRPASFEGIDEFFCDKKLLHPILSECRVHKTDLELDLMRHVNKISSEAHVEVMRFARVGIKEYHLESTFTHHIYMNGGCRYCSYTCICASGRNSAVLHYGHAAAPNDKILKDGDMALLDMGAEYHCYGSDITCSFPVNGKFSDDQCVVYTAVLLAQKAVISGIKPGVSWTEMHRLAERTILEKLKQSGALQGEVEDMMRARLGAVFMPHGLGHFLGLDVHDVGGFPKGAERILEPGLKSLRTVRTLEEGMVITVEPGCYFIDAVLDPAILDSTKSHFFVKHIIERLRKVGGVRLEDDVVVTADGCENLTKCPREIWEVEAVMAGAPWPLEIKN